MEYEQRGHSSLPGLFLLGLSPQYLHVCSLGAFCCSPPEPFSVGCDNQRGLISSTSSEHHGMMYTGSTKKRLVEHAMVHKWAYLHKQWPTNASLKKSICAFCFVEPLTTACAYYRHQISSWWFLQPTPPSFKNLLHSYVMTARHFINAPFPYYTIVRL